MLVFGAPPISGLGTSAGFKLMVEATGSVNYDALQAEADNLATRGNEQPGLVGLFNGFRARTPQLYVTTRKRVPRREKVKSMGVSLSDVFDTLQACVGSYYVNDFNRFGRTWQVIAEGAGAEMRRTLGTAVFAGMIGVTFFGLFLTPVFYFVVMWLVERKAPAVQDHPAGSKAESVVPRPG